MQKRKQSNEYYDFCCFTTFKSVIYSLDFLKWKFSLENEFDILKADWSLLELSFGSMTEQVFENLFPGLGQLKNESES